MHGRGAELSKQEAWITTAPIWEPFTVRGVSEGAKTPTAHWVGGESCKTKITAGSQDALTAPVPRSEESTAPHGFIKNSNAPVQKPALALSCENMIHHFGLKYLGAQYASDAMVNIQLSNSRPLKHNTHYI